MVTNIYETRNKYLWLKDVIINDIRSGKLGHGDKLLPERELMQYYKMSYSTVTRALYELKNSGYIERKWGKGTFVTHNTLSKTHIALTFQDTIQITHPQITKILQGIGKTVEEKKWSLQIFFLPNANIFCSDNNLLPSMLKDNKISGIIGCSPHPAENLEDIQRMGIPFVSINHLYPSVTESVVLPDIKDTARRMIHELVDRHGHRRIHILGAPPVKHTARFYRASTLLTNEVLSELREKDIQLDDWNIGPYSYVWDDIREDVKRILSSDSRPTALLVYNNTIAVEAIRLAADLGLQVPEDISVISWAHSIQPDLSSVLVPWKTLGSRSVQIMEEVMSGQSPEPCYIPVSLVPGNTCGSAPA